MLRPAENPVSLFDKMNAIRSPHFDGVDYQPELDFVRLTGQLKKIKDLMNDGLWRSLSTISKTTMIPEASVSAQLRNLRKPRFGAHIVERKRDTNTWFYRVVR